MCAESGANKDDTTGRKGRCEGGGAGVVCVEGGAGVVCEEGGAGVVCEEGGAGVACEEGGAGVVCAEGRDSVVCGGRGRYVCGRIECPFYEEGANCNCEGTIV